MKCLKRSSSIADVVGNDDLLIEILVRLPAKLLIRFQLVSKHWRSLISARSFSHLHTLRLFRGRKPQPSFLLRTRYSIFYVFNPTVNRLIPFGFKFPNVKILQSCNGLLLLECNNNHCGYIEYYVCNPTTMECRNLNLNLNLKIRIFLSGLCLVFDPYKSSHYKVVRFTREVRSRYVQFSVYDSETHEWKEGGEFESERSRLSDGIYWNNRIYFSKRYRGSPLFCFSLEDEKMNLVPDHPRKSGRRKTYTMESNGHLHYLVLSVMRNKNFLYVFEMDDSGWFEKYRADFNPIIEAGSLCGGSSDISLFGMVRGEREEDSILFYFRGRIMIYRFFDEVFGVVVDLRKEDQLFFDFEVYAHQFIESLVRL